MEHIVRDIHNDVLQLLAYRLLTEPDINEADLTMSIENRDISKSNYEISKANHDVARLNHKISKDAFYAIDVPKKGFYLQIKELKEQIQELRQIHQIRDLAILREFERVILLDEKKLK